MGLLDGVGEKISDVFSPVTDFFGFFKLFMLKVEIFFTNFGFVLLWLVMVLLILSFVTFPFWFPALMKRYKAKSVGRFLDNALSGMISFFFK